MQFAVSIPQVVGARGVDAARLGAYLARAETLGFESAWVQESVLGPQAPVLSPLGVLSFAAACSARIRLGCAVFVTPLHSPVRLAHELATVDQLCHGRLEVGVVAGGRGRNFAAFGLSPDGAISRFNEGLELMKSLWTQHETTFDGRFAQLDHAVMGLKPVQQPHPPIWFGGHHPDALRRAVRHGQGFIGAGSQTTVRFAEQVRMLRELRANEGRTEPFKVAKRVYVVVDEDVARGTERMGAALSGLYPTRSANDLLDVAVIGPPQECIRGLQAVADAGAELLLLNPLFDESAQLERLATDVMPSIR